MEYIKYLGVNISKDLSTLFDINVMPLCRKISNDIKRRDLIPILNFESLIETVKMNILPKLLYQFKTLPIVISDTQFKKWDNMISRFIWQGKRPRIV